MSRPETNRYPDRVVPGRLIEPEAFQKSGDALAVALTVLSGDQLYRDRQGDFVVDLDSLVIEKERLTLDYDHNTAEVIGTVGGFSADGGTLRADAEIFSSRPNDRAADVIARIERKTPYECSPLLMLREASVEEVAEEEQTTVNGRIMSNVTVYRNVPVLGIALCPYGTDRHTGVLALKLEYPTTKEKEKMADETKCDEKKEELNNEGTENSTYDAHPDLEEMIVEFGEQKGLEFFRRGLTMDEAGAEDYAELKAARLAAETDEKPPTAPPDESPQKPDDKETVAALRAQILKNKAQLARVTAMLKKGEAVPLSANPAELNDTPPKKTFPSAAHAYADRVKKNGIKEKA